MTKDANSNNLKKLYPVFNFYKNKALTRDFYLKIMDER